MGFTAGNMVTWHDRKTLILEQADAFCGGICCEQADYSTENQWRMDRVTDHISQNWMETSAV